MALNNPNENIYKKKIHCIIYKIINEAEFDSKSNSKYDIVQSTYEKQTQNN